MCTFFYVDALARAGRLTEAELTFQKMFTYANHLPPRRPSRRKDHRARQAPSAKNPAVAATYAIVCPNRTCVSSLLAVPLKLGESIVTSFPCGMPRASVHLSFLR